MVDWTNASATAPAPTATRAGVLRPDQLAAHVRLDRADCGPDVAAWVENHWSLRWDLPDGAFYLSSTLPHPACNLSVELTWETPSGRSHRSDQWFSTHAATSGAHSARSSRTWAASWSGRSTPARVAVGAGAVADAFVQSTTTPA